jgi:hypothetical protein
MEDTLITFETAKLTKEARFNWNVDSYFINPNKTVYSFKLHKIKEFKHECAKGLYKGTNFNKVFNLTSAPTQSLLQKWLREVHKIQLFVIPVGNVSFDLKYYCYSILSHDTDEGVHSKNRFITYEEALEEGLKYALSKLVIPRRKKGEIL